MTSFRLLFAAVAGCCLLHPALLAAADPATPPAPATPAPSPVSDAPPFTMDKHYSADMTVTLKGGTIIGSKSYIDGDKMRSDVKMSGMAMSIIVRKDTKKMYQVLTEQKMVMESDFDPTKSIGQKTEAAYGPQGKFELIGPETIDGVACTKYKVTPDKAVSDQAKPQVFFFWLDTAKKVPVEMAAMDGSMNVKWTNYAPGAQDAALFEPPTGYTVMQMPAGMGMPGGAPGGMPGSPGGAGGGQ